MEIKPPAISASQSLAIPAQTAGGLELKLGQILEAKVIETGTMLNTLKLSVADKTLVMQGQSALNLAGGEALTLQVIKLLPSPEFKIMPQQLLAAPQQAATGSPPLNAQTLTLVSNTLPLTESLTPAALANLVGDRRLNAVVTALTDSKVTLSIELPADLASEKQGQPVAVSLTLDMRQLKLPTAPGSAGLTANLTASANGSNPPTVTHELASGQTLILRAIKDTNPPLFSATAPLADRETTLLETQKRLLPIQMSPAPLLQQLQDLLAPSDPELTVAETLQRLAREILIAIPTRSQLSDPVLLKNAVENSGLFLESKLAALLAGKAEAALPSDFKFKLSKFIETLLTRLNDGEQKNTDDVAILKESLKKAEGMLAKLTLDQVHSLPRDESPKQGWIFELPYFDNQQPQRLQIEIEQDKTSDSEAKPKNWTASITITPPELATIHCKISCYDGSINTRFWSEAPATVDKINAHLDYLKQQLEQKGLVTGFMEAYQGKPASDETGKKPLAQLLSVKA